MSYQPPPSQGGDSRPYTATTDASYDYDDQRPSTSAGGAQWTYPASRPTTSRAGKSRGKSSRGYTGGTEGDYIEEEDEEWEESEDEDVFTYLPPDTTQQQQLQHLQNQQQARLQAAAAAAAQQKERTQVEPAAFAYTRPATGADPSVPVPTGSAGGHTSAQESAPGSAANHPAGTTVSTPYSSPTPKTPSSAAPQSYHPGQQQTPAQSRLPPVESPPDTTSTAPPFAFDVGAGGQRYTESYGMTPLSTAGGPAMSTVTGSREHHVSLPTATSRISSEYGNYTMSAPMTGDTHGGMTSGAYSSRDRSFDDTELRYRPDSKRTKGSSSGDSAEIRTGRESVKTDLSISNAPYTPTLPSTPDTRIGRQHNIMYTEDGELEDSPYPEVRASVSNTDDPDMPALTFRAWFVGLLLCIVGAALNMFFTLRYPAPYVSPLILLLLAFPIGKTLAYIMPIRSWLVPSNIPWIGGQEFSFNPGPFNIKEHVLVYVMANVAINPPYGMHIVIVADKKYNYPLGVGFTFLLLMATQITGFSLAGICRRFLVWPASLIWPANLVTCTLLNTLHAEDEEVEGGGISRFRFFIYVAPMAFFYYFLPGFLFTGLSYFAFICWIRPNNIVINQLFGAATGLGMGILNFDWNQIAYIGSPLMVPWWAEVHIFIGFVFFYWILVPIIYYKDIWKTGHLPLASNTAWDRFATPYDIDRIITPDMTLNATAYNEYSPLYLSATYAMTYLIAFMLSTAILVHTFLYHGRAMWNGLRKLKTEDEDIHAKLMRNYPEVPDWWYGAMFVVFFLFSIGAVLVAAPQIKDVDTPVWALFLAVILPIIYVVPSAYVYAMTGQPVGINLLAETIPGALLPNRPIANMVLKCYSVQTMQVALAFTQDLKLGHYMKVPPRATFMVQGVATVIAVVVQIGVKQWLFSTVSDICSPKQASHLSCPNNEVFYAASVIWGLIGPSRQFGKGELYYVQVYALIIGAFLPIPFWWWQRKNPKSVVRYVNIPVLLNGPTFIPPATGINFSAWFGVGFIFQYLVRTRNFRWWSKFNYILSAALDSGTIFGVVFVFLTLQLPKDGKLALNWWGNTVWQNTADAMGTPYYSTDPDVGF
ncbi:hypothetical protein FRC00_001436 [Tulasnella sp. 408]|nr:hypothetical protein FRC00_001436 [Tulasnella sp. 408]